MSENWNGRPTETIGNLLDIVTSVDDAEAAEFMSWYQRRNAHAAENIGYLIGYVEPRSRREELYARFRTMHPIAKGIV